MTGTFKDLKISMDQLKLINFFSYWYKRHYVKPITFIGKLATITRRILQIEPKVSDIREFYRGPCAAQWWFSSFPQISTTVGGKNSFEDSKHVST